MKLLKHRNCTDVAIEVVSIYLVRQTKVFKVKINWWNIGRCHAPWSMGITQKIEVPLEKWPEWEPYEWRHRHDT